MPQVADGSVIPSARSGATSQNPLFSSIEQAIQRTFNSQQPGQRNDWREVEGAYVLFPPSGRAPQAVVHFLGGAFVGAAPQISYRLFLEALSNRDVLVRRLALLNAHPQHSIWSINSTYFYHNVCKSPCCRLHLSIPQPAHTSHCIPPRLPTRPPCHCQVIATPFGTNFDHLRTADECQFKFDRALRALGAEFTLLPVYGVGHSMGAVIQMLICSRYAVAVSAGMADKGAGWLLPRWVEASTAAGAWGVLQGSQISTALSGSQSALLR